jgi:hypothetical protein
MLYDDISCVWVSVRTTYGKKQYFWNAWSKGNKLSDQGVPDVIIFIREQT